MILIISKFLNSYYNKKNKLLVIFILKDIYLEFIILKLNNKKS